MDRSYFLSRNFRMWGRQEKQEWRDSPLGSTRTAASRLGSVVPDGRQAVIGWSEGLVDW